MAQQYRAIVIGCGAVGAAATYWLSRRLGGGVLALEQYRYAGATVVPAARGPGPSSCRQHVILGFALA